MQYLHFSQQCFWGFGSSRIWYYVVEWEIPDIPPKSGNHSPDDYHTRVLRNRMVQDSPLILQVDGIKNFQNNISSEDCYIMESDIMSFSRSIRDVWDESSAPCLQEGGRQQLPPYPRRQDSSLRWIFGREAMRTGSERIQLIIMSIGGLQYG